MPSGIYKRKPLSEETKRKIGLANAISHKGIKLSEEHKMRMMGKIPWNKGLRYEIKNMQERFWEKVNRTEECWNWKGSLLPSGYGNFSMNKKPSLSHRVSWEMHNGKIPKGIFVLHKCDNRKCVNPDHLFLGTHTDNARDRESKNRGNHAKGDKCRTCKLSNREVNEIRRSYETGRFTQTKLAKLFKVTQSTIWFIITRRTWKHLI